VWKERGTYLAHALGSRETAAEDGSHNRVQKRVKVVGECSTQRERGEESGFKAKEETSAFEFSILMSREELQLAREQY
jgi:hypothetical protein